MVRLNRVVPEGAATVLVKLEMQNPGGSVKDRIALSMIEEAEKRGDISPGKTTIVERTSGNTGIGLAMVAAAKGYRCILIMPQVPSMYERYILCRKFGCEVHLTSVLQDDFSRTLPFMLDHLNALLKENPDYWTPYQFESDDNPLAHLTTTAPEIWEQTGGVCDAFVARGTSRRLPRRVRRAVREPCDGGRRGGDARRRRHRHRAAAAAHREARARAGVGRARGRAASSTSSRTRRRPTASPSPTASRPRRVCSSARRAAPSSRWRSSSRSVPR